MDLCHRSCGESHSSRGFQTYSLSRHIQSTASVPEFVDNDYSCESGVNEETFSMAALSGHHLDNPLWDGRQCLDDCCRGSPFVKTLANGPTTDPLEIRICNVPGEFSGNILVEEVKIYVQ